MRVSYYQRWLLWRMSRRVCRSDPHLAAMLTIFARLYAAETISSVEQAPRFGTLSGLAWLGGVIADLYAPWLPAPAACTAA